MVARQYRIKNRLQNYNRFYSNFHPSSLRLIFREELPQSKNSMINGKDGDDLRYLKGFTPSGYRKTKYA